MEDQERLLDANGVAELLSIRPGTVYDWVYRGILPHIVLNRGPRRSCIRFRPEDIRQFIEERTRASCRPSR